MAEEKEVLQEEVKEENVMEAIVHDDSAEVITIKKLLEAGVHYGHQTKRWNPKMAKYIYTAKNGIYIIDLTKTKLALTEAYKQLESIVLEGGKVLIVGTKDNVKETVKEEAERSGSFYVTNRWLGGILTNFKTIQTRIRRLKELEAQELDGTYDRLPKKEVALLKKEKEKLSKNLEGIKEMRKLPNAVIVCDPAVEHTAVAEARKLRIPVFGLADTTCDPDVLDFPIPANDDATRSVSLIIGLLADAIVESKGGITAYAYIKDEGEEVTMKDAVRQADKENAERIAAIRKARQEKQERMEKYQAMKKAQREEAAKAAAAASGEAKAEKPEEKPAEEKKAPAKKPAAKKAPAKKAEEAPAEGK